MEAPTRDDLDVSLAVPLLFLPLVHAVVCLKLSSDPFSSFLDRLAVELLFLGNQQFRLISEGVVGTVPFYRILVDGPSHREGVSCHARAIVNHLMDALLAQEHSAAAAILRFHLAPRRAG